MAANSKATTKLFVGHLPEVCSKDDLEELFSNYGRVVECDIVKDYAFVHYSNPAEAQLALQSLDGAPFHGTNIRVQLSHSRVRQKPGMGRRSTCYKCGGSGHWSKICPLAGGNYSTEDEYYGPGSYDFYDGYMSGGYAPKPQPIERYHPYERQRGVHAPVNNFAPVRRREMIGFYERPSPDYYMSRSGTNGSQMYSNRGVFSTSTYAGGSAFHGYEYY